MPARPDALEVDAGEGLRLHVEREGEGPHVLLLHGFTGSGESWRPLRAVLRETYTVCTVDLPGHGKSSAPGDPRRYALDRFATDLCLVLDALGTASAIVLGYSFGGRAALKLALRYPKRVSAMILESASPGLDDVSERDARVKHDEELAELLEHEGIGAFVARWERLPLWASQSALREDVRARVRAVRMAQSPAGLANALRGAGAGMDPAVLDRLDGITAPVLLIAGALDLKYVDFAMRMAQRLPDGRVEIVPDAGHAVHLERPAKYARVVQQFLASFQRQ